MRDEGGYSGELLPRLVGGSLLEVRRGAENGLLSVVDLEGWRIITTREGEERGKRDADFNRGASISSKKQLLRSQFS